VLLIASANIAGLLLARGVTRTGEVAVRRAMGAGGARLARQLVTESVLLTTLGGALGLAVAWNLVELFKRMTPSRFAFDVALDWRVLAFAALVCAVTGVLVGLAPALQALRVNVLEALGSGIVGSRTARGSIRRWVVIPQIGLSLVLLLVAGVHVRALMRIELTDRGYQTSDGFVVSIGRWEPRMDPFARAQMTPDERRQQQEDDARKMRDFNRNVLERVADLPGVSSVAIAASLPHSSYAPELRPLATKLPLAGGAPAEAGAIRSVVSDDYFDVMDMRLVRGRSFDGRDSLYRPKVAIVSESLESELGQGQPLVGRHVGFQDAQDGNVEWLEVVGVVGDVRPVLDDRPPLPVVYVSLMQQWQGTARNLIVRGYGGDATALADPVKRAVVGADAFAEAYGARTMEQIVAEILYPRRLAAGILGTAGVIGLTLASIGLYGVVSFSVARRRREIGIRATLGASRRDILALILREGAVVAGIGCAAGLALGVLALRLTAGLIPDLPTVDVLAFVAVPAALTLVVLAACYVPARRAARVDPAEVLRSL
jgi:predicted permease